MKLFDKNAQEVMKNCKNRARDAGLVFEDDTLEYVVSNKDLIKLTPKNMVPTLYDYWVQDIGVLQGEGKYKLYPDSNPYETVINSRPAISFYNQNNSNWMNAMIFYHVLAHIDFFRKNKLFRKTWDEDFVEKAVLDKKRIKDLRSEKGRRKVDYVIEFSRGIDNLVGFFENLSMDESLGDEKLPEKLDYYFGDFLQKEKKLPSYEVLDRLEEYNQAVEKGGAAKREFSMKIKSEFREFNTMFEKFKKNKKKKPKDLMEFIIQNSPKLKKEKHKWMASIIDIVRDTSLYFGPQRRTKIINEGWASYWHNKLFLQDPLLKGHQVDYAVLNARLTTVQRVGTNPYAIGKILIEYVEDLADKGKLSPDFKKIKDIEEREKYDKKTERGKEAIFKLRENFSDFTLINSFIDQDFVDKHDLFVVGKKPNTSEFKIDLYVKSRKAEDYKKMLLSQLHHPPNINIDEKKTNDSNFYLKHCFEGKELKKDYIENTMLGIEYLWGGQVQLETTELVIEEPKHPITNLGFSTYEREVKPQEKKVVYTMKDRKLTKEVFKK